MTEESQICIISFYSLLKESRLKNSKKYILKSPDGVDVEVVDMKKFCVEHNFWPSNMCNVVKGKKQSYKGWTLVKDCGYMREELGSRRFKKIDENKM